jgi:hypothetical protein
MSFTKPRSAVQSKNPGNPGKVRPDKAFPTFTSTPPVKTSPTTVPLAASSATLVGSSQNGRKRKRLQFSETSDTSTSDTEDEEPLFDIDEAMERVLGGEYDPFPKEDGADHEAEEDVPVLRPTQLPAGSVT